MYASPFHLARVFHACTGFTLHRYRLHLRLRAALARLSEPGIELTGLAFELGFSSLGHSATASGARSASVPPPPGPGRRTAQDRGSAARRRSVASDEAHEGGDMRGVARLALLGGVLLVTQVAGAAGQFVEPT